MDESRAAFKTLSYGGVEKREKGEKKKGARKRGLSLPFFSFLPKPFQSFFVPPLL
jgi:hypothetical protein